MIKFKFNEQGLMPAIVQDYDNHEVLMLAYVNRVAIQKMLKLGKTCFYSRSRKSYWIKGETSGHIQLIKKIYTDCDRDTLLIQVKQKGGACHLGYRSCFVHGLGTHGKKMRVRARKVFDPKKIYGA
ncbi:MAG: phosphoribosyl-AMP cyclohydrolase [Omnitrophica bacterium RIFCSPHIGHO2_02_FULL_49_9]|nr:MAG: phosphoribosyl-AMP cyclohydrolase [Omnitrophica bacterium RIFCSPHIGHO2_02_FULL_49_9]OGW90364.1 MAG: phosphoribosyl-AMP cyclohydrolase [Omnitrophica bacterium RIFCSPLOWO2_01_FULL_50_24]